MPRIETKPEITCEEEKELGRSLERAYSLVEPWEESFARSLRISAKILTRRVRPSVLRWKLPFTMEARDPRKIIGGVARAKNEDIEKQEETGNLVRASVSGSQAIEIIDQLMIQEGRIIPAQKHAHHKKTIRPAGNVETDGIVHGFSNGEELGLAGTLWKDWYLVLHNGPGDEFCFPVGKLTEIKNVRAITQSQTK